jgi:hypothetical protein
VPKTINPSDCVALLQLKLSRLQLKPKTYAATSARKIHLADSRLTNRSDRHADAGSYGLGECPM